MEVVSSEAGIEALEVPDAAPPVRETELVSIYIYSQADIEALQARDAGRLVVVKLETLASVDSSRQAYALLLPVVRQRSWPRARLGRLSRLAGLALELSRIQVDLLPRLEIDGGDLEVLLLVKNAAMNVRRLAKSVAVGRLFDDRVTELVDSVIDAANRVLNGARDEAWLQALVPDLLKLVVAVSVTPVRFAST